MICLLKPKLLDGLDAPLPLVAFQIYKYAVEEEHQYPPVLYTTENWIHINELLK